MSDIIDIGELRKSLIEKTEKQDLTEFATKQQQVIEMMAFELKKYKEKNQHLESLLTSLTKGETVQEITPEEMICVEQIQILKAKSSERELSLDEVKRLDILIRNLKTIRGDNGKLLDAQNLEKADPNDLIAIAKGSE